MPSMKTLRVTLSDIVGGTGGSGSTAVVHARYVTANGRGRDVHLTDGTIVVPVRRSVTPGTGPEVFDFTVIPSDDADVREVDRGFLTEVSWTVTAPEGGKSHGVRRVLVPSTADAVVQLGSLYDPPEIPAVTAQRIIEGGTAADPVYIIKIRRDTTAGWAAEDPVLALGERGVDLDTDDERVGDGVTVWSLLPASSHYAADAQGYAADAQGYAAAAGSSESAAAGHAADAQGHADAAALLLADADAIDITIGTVTTVPTGGTATAGITGTAPGKVLNLGIPTGATGAANSLAVGTVTTGAAGSSAAASITGTAPSQTLNLTIPTGATGAAGTINTSTATNLTGIIVGNGTTIAAGRTITGTPDEITVTNGSGASGNPTLSLALTAAKVGALPIPDPGSYYPTDTLTAALQLIGGRERYGTGSPEGVVTASVGTYYTDTAGTYGAWRWLKKTGGGNTGWVVVSGDTGKRLITATMLSGWTCAWANIVRKNDVVEVIVSGLNGSAATDGYFMTLPAGFRDSGVNASAPTSGIATGTGFTSVTVVYSTGVCNAGAARPTSGQWRHIFTTADPWPTTLPGV